MLRRYDVRPPERAVHRLPVPRNPQQLRRPQRRVRRIRRHLCVAVPLLRSGVARPAVAAADATDAATGAAGSAVSARAAAAADAAAGTAAGAAGTAGAAAAVAAADRLRGWLGRRNLRRSPGPRIHIAAGRYGRGVLRRYDVRPPERAVHRIPVPRKSQQLRRSQRRVRRIPHVPLLLPLVRGGVGRAAVAAAVTTHAAAGTTHAAVTARTADAADVAAAASGAAAIAAATPLPSQPSAAELRVRQHRRR